MAIENTYLLGKNITLGCGFDLQAKAPLDSRQTVPAFAGLQALINYDAAYEGMIVYDEETKKTYQAQKCDPYTVTVGEGEDAKEKTYSIAFREFGINEAELKNLIASETTAAMEFKGAAHALPENPAKGDMYKVTNAFKVGEEDTKVGDSIVYDGEQWFIIPSGDDIEDTWRPVTDVDNDATLTFVAGDKLEKTVAADGTITYKHAVVDAPELLAENEQTRTYITEVETDGFGHITGYKTATENVVDTNTTYEFAGLPVGEDEVAPSNVYFQVTSSEEGATAEVIYIDAYTRNEADGKFVEKVEGKQLSTEDFTTALLNKLNGIAEEANKYEHAEHTAYAEGFYKVTVDAEGHVSNAAAVTKEDIVALGIPGQDTTYEKATANADGLMSKEHFDKVEGIAEGATKVENVGDGKIKINGQEATVYAHPEKHAIDDVSGLQNALNGKVDVVTGKGLSTNDLTGELKGQYDAAYQHSIVDHAPADAQANIIESVKVNGTALEIKDKAVDIAVPTGALAGKDKVAKTDLVEALATEIDNKVTKENNKSLIADSEITRLSGMSDGANKVEASTNNGYIKIDGNETVVYSHPDKHAITDVDGLQEALNGLQAKGDYAAEEHTHTKDEITDFAHTHTKSEITDFAHTHTASEITDFATEVAKVKVANAGNADSAKKVENALTVKVGGADVVFDGSAAKTANVDAAIEAAINAIPEQTDYTVAITETTDGLADGIAKKYIFSQNGAEIGSINLAKELVVTSGSVKEVTEADAPYTGAVVGDKYIELVIANQDAPIYVPAKDLVDIYTAKDGAAEVQVAISNTNEISATLVNGGITEEKFAEGVKTKLNKTWEEVGIAAGLVEVLENGQVKANKEAIEKLNGADTVEGSVAKSIKDAIADANLGQYAKTDDVDAAIEAAKTEASNQSTVVLSEAQKYADNAKAEAIADADGKVNALADNVYTKAEVENLLCWGEF